MNSVYTVGQINAYIRRMFDQDYLLERVCVRGEVSNCKYHSSGHVYFSLKDETGVIAAVIYSSDRQKLSFRLEDGMQVICLGKVSVFLQGGRYQLYVRSVRKAGLGELHERYEMLKASLKEQGLFDDSAKKPIPSYVRTLGVVTAPTGAAVRDIIQISKRRNPGIQIILYPAKVQGENSALSIANGIRMLDRLGLDVIIAGRGGGSMEDLWAFNEEIVARAFYDCRTPIISAVGHQTDTVLSDYVADLRAPTPSAAAELAVGDTAELIGNLMHFRKRLHTRMQAALERGRMSSSKYSLRLSLASPKRRLLDLSQENDRRRERFDQAMTARLTAEKNNLALLTEKFRTHSPYEKLEQGFVYLTDEAGNRIFSAGELKEHDRIALRLKDGLVKAQVTSVKQSGDPLEKLGNRQET